MKERRKTRGGGPREGFEGNEREELGRRENLGGGREKKVKGRKRGGEEKEKKR